ncbi:A-kinase anchor protein 13-like isoform X4 [Halichondria panicea]|uniref:A-kinase anchor protein 13-like isoform X4 n=1 Tax=Halichondria panicea TaxID=6063 RepID=UPI00312B51B0
MNYYWSFSQLPMVKRFRHLTHTSLTSLDHPLTNGSTHTPPPTRHIPMRRRRSSIATMDVGDVQFVPSTPIKAIQVNSRDPRLAAMDRSRKTSWSQVVGSSECRSIDTGLNELDRISAEEAIQEQLVQVKAELVQLDQKKQDPSQSNHHLRLTDSHLGVMYRLSASCPQLNDEEDDDSEVPSAFLSAATSPGARSISPGSDPPQSPTEEETPYMRSISGPIPYVVTTEYSETLDSSETRARQTYSAYDIQEGNRLRQTSNSPTLIEVTGPNVEESIFEHRPLTQSSPGSSTVRSEDEYVIVSSNMSSNCTPEPELELSNSDLLTPVGTPIDPTDMPMRIPTPINSTARYKAHRRSLSSSEIEIMGSIGPDASTSSSTGWNTPITSIEENNLSTQNSSTADLEDRSRASSLLTNDTCSMHESGTSEEEVEHLGTTIKGSISLYQIENASPTKQDLLYEASDSVNEVVIRDSNKRLRLKAAKYNRYSADFLISNMEDCNEETSLKQRTNSSDVLDSTPDESQTTLKPSPLLDPTNDSTFPNHSDLSPSDVDVSFKSGENSLENSQSALFFKPTGSPKTIKKRKNKLPNNLMRSSTISHTKFDKKTRGLTKEKVGPTISALKDLLKPASDSEESDHQHDSVFESSHDEATQLRQTEEPQPRRVSSPWLQNETAPPELEDNECSSLDFTPSSPLVRDKSRKTIPSPLSIENKKHDKENLSGSLSPVSPPEEETSKNQTSTITNSPSKGSTVVVRFCDKEVCPVNEDIFLPKEKEKGKWREKIFGAPKLSKKSLSKDLSRSQEAAELEMSGKQNRPRSGKRHKYEEVLLKYVAPKEYEPSTTQQPVSPTNINRSTSLQVGINDIGAEQTSQNHSTSHNRSISVTVNDTSKFSSPKRQSEHSMVSPVKTSSSGTGLSTVEEVPNDSNSNPSPYLLQTTSHAGPPSGESENEQEEIHVVRTLSVSHPVLRIQEEFTWDKTVDRRLYKKLTKAERERQAILHELLQTEQNHFRSLHVLKLVFRQQMTKVASEETIAQLFPELDNLIDISDGFLKELKSKKNETEDIMIDDLSDVLLEQFTGEKQQQMLHSFGVFCSAHLNATEFFKEQMKKKSFSRLIKQLNTLKECQRLTLPDYYLAISQRLSKLLTLLKRLSKKSESLRLDHAPRVRDSLRGLEELITNVDTMVDDNKMKMEVEAIQSKLELPRSTKFKHRKERLNFCLTTPERKLRKRGLAVWIGHGKEIAVHVILVTDMVVLLTERDQRFHLASLLDHKPPVIRLFDLHVRVNVSVKTGVQLLLLEKGTSPEMFRLEFSSKKLAREWELALNTAIDICKEKGLKCEYFGAEKVVAGEEEEVKEESDIEEDPNPISKRMLRARESLAQATKLLLPASTTTTTLGDSSRHHGIATIHVARTVSHEPFKGRNRAQTVQRPKTAFFNDDESGSFANPVGDHVISAPIPPVKVPKVKAEKKKVRLDRSSTFRNKEKERDKSAGGGGEGEGSFKVPEQQYIKCVITLKDSLQEMMNMCSEKDEEISKLRDEVITLRESLQQLSPEDNLLIPSRLSPRTSPPQPRPHSVHFDAGGLHSQSELLLRDKTPSDDETPNGSQLCLNED